MTDAQLLIYVSQGRPTRPVERGWVIRWDREVAHAKVAAVALLCAVPLMAWSFNVPTSPTHDLVLVAASMLVGGSVGFLAVGLAAAFSTDPCARARSAYAAYQARTQGPS